MKIQGITDCNCMALRRAARRITAMYDEVLAPTGLRAAQFAILATLRGANPLNVQELAEQMDLDRTTMGKNLRPLERDGLVRVATSDADRRSRVIRLTPAGVERIADALPLWLSAQQRFEAANGRKRMRGLREQLAALQIDSKQHQQGAA